MPIVTLTAKVQISVPKDYEDSTNWAVEYLRNGLEAKNRVRIIVITREDGKVQ
jgi:hypothetical protein